MISSGLVAILSGLAAAISWGAGDFSGGLASKRTSAFTVVVLSQFVSLLFLLLAALLIAEEDISTADMILGALAGMCGAIGLVALYSGLARGPMGVVAPMTAIVSTTVPVLFSLLSEGFPGIRQLLGFFSALVAMWLITRTSQDGSFRIRDLNLPIIAGIGFGLFFIFIDRVSEHAILWPLVSARTASILLVFTLAILMRQLPVPASRQLPAIALAGIFDTGGNAFFALATRMGRLDAAAIMSSLYPAVTVILAWIILKERLSRSQWLGVLLVLIAIILIAI